MNPNQNQNIISNTLVVDNFSAILTRVRNGDINSGLVRYEKTFGIDTFSKPMNLKFMETAVDITGGIITDCVMDQKGRVESNIIYAYAIGHQGRLYKIQVDDINNHIVNKDTVTLLATLSSNSPTFNYGGSIDFYTIGGTEYILIGHDKGVTRINFDGTGETFVGSVGSWTQNVPRYPKQFIGSIFYTNGSNIAQIDSTGTVTSYTKLSPGLPSNYQARDIDITADNTYLVITSSRIPQFNLFTTAPDTNAASQGESLIAYWNGTDSGATLGSSNTSFVQTAYHTFGSNEYAFGYDITGAIVSNPAVKKLSVFNAKSPIPTAVNSIGNILSWMVPELDGTTLKASLYLHGQLDQEFPEGYYRPLRLNSTLTGGDVYNVPSILFVTNTAFAGASSGYTGGYASYGRMYFSTFEYNGTSTAYKFYTFYIMPVGTGTAIGGVYETQTQLFQKKVKVPEYRIYMEPAVSNQSFQIDLIGIDGNVISGTTKVFSPSVGTDLLQFNPSHAPTSAIGLRITNTGTVSPIIHKIEIDITPAGK